MSEVELLLTWRVPCPCGNEANELRRGHQDLEDLTTSDIETEGYAARFALCFGAFATPWHREWTQERLRACQQELRRRQRP